MIINIWSLKKPALYVFIFLAAFGIILQGCEAKGPGPSPAKEAVQQFFDSLKAGDVEAALKLTLFEETETQRGPSYRAHVQEVFNKLGERLRTDVDVSIISDRYYQTTNDADVEIRLTNKTKNLSYDSFLRVVNKDGVWKIMNYLIIYYSIPE